MAQSQRLQVHSNSKNIPTDHLVESKIVDERQSSLKKSKDTQLLSIHNNLDQIQECENQENSKFIVNKPIKQLGGVDAIEKHQLLSTFYQNLITNTTEILNKLQSKQGVDDLYNTYLQNLEKLDHQKEKKRQEQLNLQKSQEQKNNQQNNQLSFEISHVSIDYPDGFHYSGDGYDTIRQGKGILYLDQDIIYEGDWLNDKYHGQGQLNNIHMEDLDMTVDASQLNLIENHWLIYEGEFQDGLFHGQGILKISNGQIYEGNFELGIPHGNGVLYDKEGEELAVGEWDQGVYI